ncbi:MAG TPA: hypothetical protein VNO35_07665, partial [Steroidobacteraceae bacterium]|nr:hypothetical protein [Steroidobacteraceae bacterium]
GLESLRSAQGDAPVARLLDVDPHTVARGRMQLLEGDIELERVRKSGDIATWSRARAADNNR